MTPFTFNGQTLRTIQIDGEPWFVAADACTILGLKFGGRCGSTAQHLVRLAPDEKRVVRRSEGVQIPQLIPLFTDKRGGQSYSLVTESGLYKLIMRSDKATAKPFQDWVTREVLPSIRKGAAGFPRPRSEI